MVPAHLTITRYPAFDALYILSTLCTQNGYQGVSYTICYHRSQFWCFYKPAKGCCCVQHRQINAARPAVRSTTTRNSSSKSTAMDSRARALSSRIDTQQELTRTAAPSPTGVRNGHQNPSHERRPRATQATLATPSISRNPRIASIVGRMTKSARTTAASNSTIQAFLKLLKRT